MTTFIYIIQLRIFFKKKRLTNIAYIDFAFKKNYIINPSIFICIETTIYIYTGLLYKIQKQVEIDRENFFQQCKKKFYFLFFILILLFFLGELCENLYLFYLFGFS